MFFLYCKSRTNVCQADLEHNFALIAKGTFVQSMQEGFFLDLFFKKALYNEKLCDIMFTDLTC